MDENHSPTKSYSSEVPRRLKLSAREIGVALALTFAAAIQLLFSLSNRESKAGNMNGREPAALIQPPRQG